MDIRILGQRFDDYSKYIRGLSKHTIARNRLVLRLYCNYSKVANIEEVTEESVQGFFVYGRTQRQWKANTFIVFSLSLRVFFRWDWLENLVENTNI